MSSPEFAHTSSLDEMLALLVADAQRRGWPVTSIGRVPPDSLPAGVAALVSADCFPHRCFQPAVFCAGLRNGTSAPRLSRVIDDVVFGAAKPVPNSRDIVIVVESLQLR